MIRTLTVTSKFASRRNSCVLRPGYRRRSDCAGKRAAGGNYSTTPNRTGQAATTAPANSSSAMTGTTESAEATFKRMDISGQGYLTKEQAQASGITSFEAADIES